MSSTDKAIKRYYSSYDEWGRLLRNAWHRLEYNTTLHFLKRYLPKRGLVLDAGGGPGRYTIALAKLGYNMVLFDLTPRLLDIALKQIRKADVAHQVEQVIEGSITDLSVFDDECFDAVLCLGSHLGHLLKEVYREQAVKELRRVVKPLSPVFISVIGRIAMLESGLSHFQGELEIDGLYEKFFKTGDSHDEEL